MLLKQISMATKTCNGNGDCLTQNTDCNTYGKYPDVICDHNCQPISCPNVEICENQAPQWYFDCHGGTCWDCKDRFGRVLTFVNNADCPICMETTRCVIQPRCTHPTCISCFKRSMYGESLPQPKFPYPEIEEQYEQEIENVICNDNYNLQEYISVSNKWEKDYPLIKEYKSKIGLWDFFNDAKYRNEENLRKCPICRQ